MIWRSRVDLSDAVLVTHDGCMDGAACAVVFESGRGRSQNVIPVSAGKLMKGLRSVPNLLDGKKLIIIADVAVNDDAEADELEKRGNVFIIDHHKTAEFLRGRPWCHIDMDACGAKLLWQQLGGPEDDSLSYLRNFVDLVDDYDRWIKRDPLSDELAIHMTLLGFEGFIQRYVHSYTDEGEWKGWTKEEELVISRAIENQKIYSSRVLRKMRTVHDEERDIKYGVVVASNHQSYIGSKILEENPSIDVAAIFDFDKGSVSLRSRKGGCDCADLALSVGGGGHQSAAGYRINQTMVIDLLHDLLP